MVYLDTASNYNPAGGAFDVESPDQGFSTNFFAEIQTGSNTAGYSLDSIGLLARFGGGVAGGGLTVQIDQDLGGSPGSYVGTLNGPNPTSLALYTYTSSSSILLAADTDYWISVQAHGVNETYYWYVSATQDIIDLGGWSETGYSYNSSWSHPVDEGVDEQAITLSATAITPTPEPSTLALASLGAASLLAFRRK